MQREFTRELGPPGKAEARVRVLRLLYGGDQSYFKATSPWVLAETRATAIRAAELSIRIAIGERDATVRPNREFAAHLTQLKIPHTFTLVPRAGHQASAVLDGLGEARWRFYREAFAGAAGFPPPAKLVAGTKVTVAYRAIEGVAPARLSLDLYPLRGPKPLPVVVMIHGGGWRIGDKGGRGMTQAKVPHFRRAGYVYASINYRLSTSEAVRHPAHADDCAAALIMAFLRDPAEVRRLPLAPTTDAEAPRPPGKTFSRLDRNSDGAITREEFARLRRPPVAFEELDADGDGRITPAEAAANEQLRARRRKR